MQRERSEVTDTSTHSLDQVQRSMTATRAVWVAAIEDAAEATLTELLETAYERPSLPEAGFGNDRNTSQLILLRGCTSCSLQGAPGMKAKFRLKVGCRLA
jgi:hypothetical protein